MNERKQWCIAMFLSLLFLFGVYTGCRGVYKVAGLTEPQAEEQVKKDQEKIIKTVDEGREVFWQTVSAGVAGVGALTAGLLARWLHTERRINGAMILGIEKGENAKGVKESVELHTHKAGVDSALAKRVRKLT